MQIIPAIDIMNGRCVRLTKGDFSTEKVYSGDPLAIARDFEDHGIHRLHLVDLDGARARHVVNIEVLRNISANTGLIIDFGGGVQSDEDIKKVFDAGANQVTAGSVVIRDRKLFDRWMNSYGADRIILGADVRYGKISIGGWQEGTSLAIADFINEIRPSGIKYIVCTEISRDGMLQGPATELYKELILQFPGLFFIASGGISSLDDITALEKAGLWGAIIGKAIYENKIGLEDLKTYIS